MRQGPHIKRGRNRGGNRRPGVPNRNHTFDSNGPDVRIRGNASQVYEKYLTLARDAMASGDRILAESYYQHGEHYYRIMSSFNEENDAQRARTNDQQANGQDGSGQDASGHSSQGRETETDDEAEGGEEERSANAPRAPEVVNLTEEAAPPEPANEVEEPQAPAPRAAPRRRRAESPPAEGAPAEGTRAEGTRGEGTRAEPAPAKRPTNDGPPTEDDIPALRPRPRRRAPSARSQAAAEDAPVADSDPAAAD